MPKPPAPPPAPDLAVIELCAERVADDDEVRGQDAWQLSALHVPALVAYARALEAANAACWELIMQMEALLMEATTVASRAAALPSLRVRDLEAENARLRAGIEDLRMFHADSWCSAQAGYRCNCGADAHNAHLDALLKP